VSLTFEHLFKLVLYAYSASHPSMSSLKKFVGVIRVFRVIQVFGINHQKHYTRAKRNVMVRNN
jgi:hypothetical protein